MKTRVFKSWKTSLVGLAILVFAGAMIWSGKTTIDSLWVAIPLAAGFIYAKDPQKFK